MNVFNLIRFRNLRGLTAQDLSLKCELQHNVVNKIESKRIGLTVERMELFADVLGISPAWLVCSPYVVSVETALLLLEKIYDYVGGFSISQKGIVTLNAPYNSFLLELKSKRNELTITHSITQEEYDNWRYNRSVYHRPDCAEKEQNIIIDNLWKYVERHKISDQKLGMAFGYDDVFSGDCGALFRLNLFPITKKNIEGFVKFFEVNYSLLADDFTIKNDDDLCHSLLALDDSPVGKFLLDDKGSIKFSNKEIALNLISSQNPPFC